MYLLLASVLRSLYVTSDNNGLVDAQLVSRFRSGAIFHEGLERLDGFVGYFRLIDSVLDFIDDDLSALLAVCVAGCLIHEFSEAAKAALDLLWKEVLEALYGAYACRRLQLFTVGAALSFGCATGLLHDRLLLIESVEVLENSRQSDGRHRETQPHGVVLESLAVLEPYFDAKFRPTR
jgi:hypothetical protein